MAEQSKSFEVEVRCHFDSVQEAYEALPFVQSCALHEVAWVTTHYGLSLFKEGQIIRISDVSAEVEMRHYLGWKGPDIGAFANVRQEIDEEITNGTAASAVFERLGGQTRIEKASVAIRELERLGHSPFMAFEGRNLNGCNELLGVRLKIMACQQLKWPIIVELEKQAGDEKEAKWYERELQELCSRYNIIGRLLREEPPTLLYNKLFSR